MTMQDTRGKIESLWRAAAEGDVDRVEAVLDDGMHDASGGNYWQSDADPRGWRRTPLHIAALEGQAAVVDLLLRHGAAVNARSKYHDTPLHFALINGNIDIITALYKAGADVTLANDEGDTPADLGKKRGINFA